MKLFKRGYIGTCTVKNRVVMPPMTTGFAGTDGQPTKQLIEFYEERAKAGVGLIYSEIFQVDTVTGRAGDRQIHTANIANILTLSQMVTAVHKYGCKMFAQLHHGGNTNNPMINDGKLYSASDVPTVTGIVPTPLTLEQIKDLEAKFIATASACKLAGFDGVEVHGAHGYLIDQFLSSSTNHREDEYGGSLENRCRFAVNIIKGIKQACGASYPVTIRLSVDEYDAYHPDAIKLEEGVEIAKIMEAAGVDAISVSCCNYFSTDTAIEPYSYPQGWRKGNAKAVKEAVSVPVIATNTIKRPEFAESMLEEEVCDFVAVGRAQLADPEWVRKAREGRCDDIRNCIGCLYCFEHLMGYGFISCSVNPKLGQEPCYKGEPEKNGAGRPVAVIGGGPAGMQASIVLANRGFNVTLFEKEAQLGGAARLAGMTAPYKDKIQWMLASMEKETREAGVNICLNTEATAESVKALDPVGVFLTTGAKPVIPRIEGINLAKVVLSQDVITGKAKVSGNIAVIGGGLTGLETAELLLNSGKVDKLSIVDMLPQLGVGMYPVVFMDIMKQLTPHSPEILTGHKIDAVTDSGIRVTDVETGESKAVEADYVVLSMGLKTNKELVKSFEDEFDRVIVLGEAATAPGRIATSIGPAYNAAFGFDPEG